MTTSIRVSGDYTWLDVGTILTIDDDTYVVTGYTRFYESNGEIKTEYHVVTVSEFIRKYTFRHVTPLNPRPCTCEPGLVDHEHPEKHKRVVRERVNAPFKRQGTVPWGTRDPRLREDR